MTSPPSTPRRRGARSRPARRGSGATRTSCPSTGRPGRSLEPGLTPLIRADRLADRLGLEELWIKNDAANPTHSFKDRVVAVALAKARELGFETVACASTGNLANAVAAHAAAAGLDSYVFVPADLEEQKLLATGVYGTQPGRGARHLRRRQPPVHGAVRDAALGVRQRQPEALLLAGLEDPRLRDRRAARLGRSRTGSSGRSPRGPCSRSSRKGIQRVDRPRAWSRASCRPSTARRPAGCSPVATAFAEGWEACKPERPRDDRQEPRDRQSRRRRRTRSSSPGRPVASIESVTDDEIRDGHPAAGGDHGHLHRDGRRSDRRRCWPSWPSAGTSASDERVVVYITGEGLKTLDADPRGLPDARDRADAGCLREPSSRSRGLASIRFLGRWRSP